MERDCTSVQSLFMLSLDSKEQKLYEQKAQRSKVMFNIEEELKKLPSKPGVYLMHGEKDEIIYDIKEAITAKVLQQFPDIGFQLLDIKIIIKL